MGDRKIKGQNYQRNVRRQFLKVQELHEFLNWKVNNEGCVELEETPRHSTKIRVVT